MGTSPYATTEGVEHLNVPTATVSRGARDFMVPCLYAVVEYFANYYPDGGTRIGTQRVTIEELNNLMATDEGGWRPKQDTLSQLSNMVRTIDFDLESWGTSAPKRLSSLVQEHYDRYCPLIAYVDGLLMREGGDIRGPIYTIVVVGFNLENAVIMDPWQGKKQVVPHQKLETSWDEEKHQVIDNRVH